MQERAHFAYLSNINIQYVSKQSRIRQTAIKGQYLSQEFEIVLFRWDTHMLHYCLRCSIVILCSKLTQHFLWEGGNHNVQ